MKEKKEISNPDRKAPYLFYYIRHKYSSKYTTADTEETSDTQEYEYNDRNWKLEMKEVEEKTLAFDIKEDPTPVAIGH